jgi:demethylmenaquinone methyltransferase / 2-methoxy-6-polyprenyl-1,4-benzoquinol methylase
VTRAALDKQPAEIAAMFDAVARRYDITNTVLSLGQDRLWRQATRRALNPQPGQRILDLAAGTAVSSAPLAKAGAEVVAADFSLGMLGAAPPRPGVELVAADGLALPFVDSSFDAATISFGLRNVADPVRCLRELRRVVRAGGRLVVCEFSRPVWAPFRTVYVEYLMRALPTVARAVSSSPDAYVYLAESIRAWPDQAALAGLLEQAGWADVGWRNLTGGIVALHRAAVPTPVPASGAGPTSPAPAATRAQIAT